MKLHEQVKVTKASIQEAQLALWELEAYLHSSKFHLDTTVQVKDVLNRLVEIKLALSQGRV